MRVALRLVAGSENPLQKHLPLHEHPFRINNEEY